MIVPFETTGTIRTIIWKPGLNNTDVSRSVMAAKCSQVFLLYFWVLCEISIILRLFLLILQMYNFVVSKIFFREKLLKTGLNNVCACAKIKSNFRAKRFAKRTFMFSWMTTTGKRRKFSIILSPKRKYISLMMWKMTIWTLWSLHRSFFVKICRGLPVTQ